MRKIELVFAGLSGVGLLLRLLSIPGYEILLSVSLLALAIVYFYFGFILLNNIQYRNMFRKDSYAGLSKYQLGFSIAVSLLLSFLVMAVLFYVLDWEGAGTVIFYSLIMTMVLLAASIVLIWMRQEIWTKAYWWRLGPALLFVVAAYFNFL